MKKTLTSILSVVLLLGLLLCLCGCQKETGIVGTWEGEVNFAKSVTKELAEEDEEMAKYFDIDTLNLTLRMTFREDGTFVMEIDTESAGTAFEGIESKLVEGMRAYMEALLEGTGVSVDELLELTGMSLEDLVDETFNEEMIEEMFAGTKTEANYKAVDGKLYVSESLNDEIDESEYQSYSVSGKELRLLESENTEDDPFAGLYPIVLKKVS